MSRRRVEASGSSRFRWTEPRGSERRPSTAWLAAACLVLPAVTATACSRPGDAEAHAAARNATFEEAFHASSSVELEEPDSALVTGVETLAVGPDGRLAVPDREMHQVRIYDSEGRLVANLGREGSGPGEFDAPLDVAFAADGRLFVSEAGESRITRFTRDFRFDTTFRVQDAYYVEELEPLGERLLAYVSRPQAGAECLRIYDLDGRLVDTFHPRRREYRDVPYWSATAGRILAVSRAHVVAGGNLLYPLVHYDATGALRDSIGRPPPAWRPVPRPERGQFMGPDRFRRFERWRRTFATIASAAIYRDSLLVVTHERLDPDVLAYEEVSYTADVYRLNGEKVWVAVPLPGPLLAGGEFLHVLARSPPGPWTISRLRIGREEGSS